LVSVTSGIIPAVPDQTDDPEVVVRLAKLGWTVEEPLPTLTRLAAYGVIRRDGLVLLCRVAPGNLGAGFWTLPGGGLEFGESPEAAAVREVEEETGLLARITGQPSIHSDTGVWPFSAGPVSYHHVRFVYPMELTGGAERREVDGSTDEFAWLTEAEVDALAAEDRMGDLVVAALERFPASAAAGARPAPRDHSSSSPEASSA
jgi:8-oxo-dGTP diphosphatase